MSSPSEMAIFVAVVREQGFTAAAKKLNVSKSHVSKQVERLEERLGVRLLNRTTRQVSVTELGKVYFERARQILADIEEAERAVSRLQTSPRGVLRITAPMTFGSMYLDDVIFDFVGLHPELDVEVRYSDQVVDLVDAGLDMGVRIGALADSSLIARKIAPVHMVCVASPRYLEQNGTPRHPRDLKDHSCLHYSYQSSGTTWQFTGAEETISVKVDGRVVANNGQALLTAAVKGLGISVAPDFIAAEAVKSGELEPILTEWHRESLAIWAVYPHRRYLSQKVRLFVDYLVERFETLPWAV